MFDDERDDSDSEAGLNFLVGVNQPRGLFFEFKLGAMDSPDFKFGVGIGLSPLARVGNTDKLCVSVFRFQCRRSRADGAKSKPK